jgi:nitrite reductase/ring-hydroxylating ferredoxin subunit
MLRSFPISVILLFVGSLTVSSAFTLVMMGSRRGKGGLKKSLNPNSTGDKLTPPKKTSMNSLNNGKGQEITGVTLPAEGSIKGWEFGNQVCVVCANVKGKLYALQGDCPRCAFDLWKGDLITDDPAWDDLPRVACPTCATTFSLKTGARGPSIKRSGLAGFVGGLAKTATQNDEMKDAKAFIITREEDGRVYCKER